MREGVSQIDRDNDPEDLAPLRHSTAVSLSDLAVDYAFFTHGALFTWGGFDTDPLQDIINESSLEVVVAVLDYPVMLFSNIYVPNKHSSEFAVWNRRLLATPHKHFSTISHALAQVAGVDRVRKRFMRTFAQQVKVFDPVIMLKPGVVPSPLPTIDVVAYGVDATDCHRSFSDVNVGQGVAVKLMPLPVRPETVELAEKVLSGTMSGVNLK
jgi:hypothetical protein